MERNIGQYRLERKIGEGGMAEVWQAVHAHLNHRVAIKFLLPRFAGDLQIEERFLNEGKRQARLRHPNIVAAIDFLQTDGRSYLVMQYVEGESLEARLEAHRGPLSLEEVHAISWDILSALDYAHSQDPPLVHRDVKPSNVLIETSGRVFLTDFGIALALGGERRLTTVGTAVGTPDFMSPEQIVRPQAIDRRSDIYSFGCVLYAMLTGAPPFSTEGATEFSIQDAHVRSAPPPLRSKNPDVSPAVERVVLKCMEKDPANRFQSCRQVMTALDEAIKSPVPAFAAAVSHTAPLLYPPPHVPAPPPATPAQKPEPGRGSRAKLFAAVGGVVVAAALAAYLLWPGPETVLRLEGSTTIGDALAPALLRAFAEHEGGRDISSDSKLVEDGSGNKATQSQIRASMPGKWRTQIFQVMANGSGNAFKALQGKTADLGMASRRIDDKEVRDLAGAGDMRSPASEIVLGLDGLAIVINRANPVATLTRRQIAAIFSGGIIDWSAVGGRPGAIHLYGWNSESDAFDTFVMLVLAGNRSAFSRKLEIRDNGEAIAEAVASDPGGAGYVELRQIGAAKALAVSDGLGTAALPPTSFTVATEDYILSCRLYLYLPRNPSALARRFAAFAEGPDGQAVVRKIHFVEQTGELEDVTISGAAPEEYRKLTAGKRRMRFNFRFEPNSDELDTKALADTERASNSLFALGTDNVYLFGFADNRGKFQDNLVSSRKRAEAVGTHLVKSGLHVHTEGFSSEMPIADDSTDEGRARNRRVEVWVP